jgi:hypothetical protein
MKNNSDQTIYFRAIFSKFDLATWTHSTVEREFATLEDMMSAWRKGRRARANADKFTGDSFYRLELTTKGETLWKTDPEMRARHMDMIGKNFKF